MIKGVFIINNHGMTRLARFFRPTVSLGVHRNVLLFQWELSFNWLRNTLLSARPRPCTHNRR